MTRSTSALVGSAAAPAGRSRRTSRYPCAAPFSSTLASASETLRAFAQERRRSARATLPSDGQQPFLLTRQVANCSRQTVAIYKANLSRFGRETGVLALTEITPLVVQNYLTGLQKGMKAISVHQHYRCLRAFYGWCVETGLLTHAPTNGITVRCPKTLPRVPEDETIGRLLAACDDTFEGRRNRALVSLLADSGLRISEALRLRIEDINFSAGTLVVRGGKGLRTG